MKRFEKYIKNIHQDFPEFIISSIKKIGEGDNSNAFLINGDYIFRFSKREEVKKQIRREIVVLPKIKPLVTLEIPSFEFISPEMNYVGYRMIKGENLSREIFNNLQQKDQQSAQKTLADFLSSIHSFDLSELKNCGLETMDLKEEYSDNFEKAKRLIFPHLPQNKKEIISRFFIDYLGNENNFKYKECLVHNDFSKDHILFNTVNKQITGIIDFGDIAIGDPDYDLMYLLDEFGEKFIIDFLKYYTKSNSGSLLQKIKFFTLANKIQLFPEEENIQESDDWEYAFSLLNEWFEKPDL